MRYLFLGLGWINVALGVIGAFLPVMPTTVFLIIAAGFFAKSSPRLERWILEHPRYGGPVRAWRRDKSISARHKAFAVGCMAASVALTLYFGAAMPFAAKLSVVALVLVGSAYVLSRKTRRDEVLPDA